MIVSSNAGSFTSRPHGVSFSWVIHVIIKWLLTSTRDYSFTLYCFNHRANILLAQETFCLNPARGTQLWPTPGFTSWQDAMFKPWTQTWSCDKSLMKSVLEDRACRNTKHVIKVWINLPDHNDKRQTNRYFSRVSNVLRLSYEIAISVKFFCIIL